MMGPLKFPAVVAAVLLAASCAGGQRWENPGVPERMWRADEASCRRQAAAEAEREILRDPGYLRNPGVLRGRSLEARMARFGAAKSERNLFSRCMARRGYRKVEAGE